MSEWISVKDRLPEKSGMYIIYNPKWHFENRVFASYFHSLPSMWTYSGVTHWMPLPERPKEEE